MLQVGLAEGVVRHRAEALKSEYAALIRPVEDMSGTGAVA